MAPEVLQPGHVLDVGPDGVGVFKPIDSAPAPAPAKPSSDSWARFWKSAKAEDTKPAPVEDDSDLDLDDDSDTDTGTDLDLEGPDDKSDDEPEERDAGDDTGESIALTGEAVAQIEDAFLQADDFEVPYETRKGIATWARSMLRSGAQIDEAQAIEHLTSPHFGLDEKTAEKLVGWYLKSATAWNEKQKSTSTAKSMTRDQARAAIDKIRKDPAHLFHPQHAGKAGRDAALQEMRRLYAIAYKE